MPPMSDLYLLQLLLCLGAINNGKGAAVVVASTSFVPSSSSSSFSVPCGGVGVGLSECLSG